MRNLGWKTVVSIAVLALGQLSLQLIAQSRADEEAIRRVFEEDMAAHRAGNPDRAASIFTDDVVWLPPTGPAVQGRAAIRERYRASFAQFEIEFSLHSEETHIFGFGGWAFDRGTTRGTITPKQGGPPRALHDKYIALLQKGPDGNWKIARLMWSPVAESQTK